MSNRSSGRQLSMVQTLIVAISVILMFRAGVTPAHADVAQEPITGIYVEADGFHWSTLIIERVDIGSGKVYGHLQWLEGTHDTGPVYGESHGPGIQGQSWQHQSVAFSGTINGSRLYFQPWRRLFDLTFDGGGYLSGTWTNQKGEVGHTVFHKISQLR